MKIRAVAVALALAWLILPAGSEAATECFPASGRVKIDAESIQLQAAALGRRVGDAAAYTAAVLLAGRMQLSDNPAWEICLRLNDGLEITFRAEDDDSEPIWLPLPAGPLLRGPVRRI